MVTGLIVWGVIWKLPPAAPQVRMSAPSKVEEGHQLGPFVVDGNSYVVSLDEKPRCPGSTQEAGNTVVKMEIRDSTGAEQYQRTFPAQAECEEFSDAWLVSARILNGKSGSGLLITYEGYSEPSAPTPENSAWWQFFGVVNGALKPFSGPISVQGELLPNESPSDVLRFKVWAHHFRMIFPVEVNWMDGSISPSLQCDSCQYNVLPEDLSGRQELTFVRLCPVAEPKCDRPERTLAKKDSTIDLLAAQADVHWTAGLLANPSNDPQNPMGDQGEITVSNEVWLKIRIDGKEGWIHDEEDFTTLSFPFEQ